MLPIRLATVPISLAPSNPLHSNPALLKTRPVLALLLLVLLSWSIVKPLVSPASLRISPMAARHPI
jgi:hypothetical protein